MPHRYIQLDVFDLSPERPLLSYVPETCFSLFMKFGDAPKGVCVCREGGAGGS